MKYFLFLFLMFTASLFANGGPVGAKATVTNKHIVVGDVVELKIRARGNKVTFPTINSIDGIKVLSQHERVTNIHTYDHGEFTRERTTLILYFAPQGNMTIPAYTIHIDGKVYKTNPIKLKVKDSASSKADSRRMFSLNIESSKKSVVTGEAFLLTIAISMDKESIVSKKLKYERPAFEGFFVENVTGEKSYIEGEQNITEFRYILTPHTEGNFTLGPAEAKIGLQIQKEKDGKSVNGGTKWFDKASNILDVEVLPPEFSSDLVGKFTLKREIDKQEVNANKAVNMTVTIEGEGNLINFDIARFEIDGVTVYSNDAQTELKVVEGKIYSTFTKKFVFISEKDFRIPNRIFSMYDPQEGKVTELKMLAFDVDVKRSKNVSKARQVAAPVKKETQNSKVTVEEEPVNLPEHWWILLFSFISGIFFTNLLYAMPKRKEKFHKENDALKILYGHISEDTEVEEMVRRLYARKNGDLSVEIDKEKLKKMLDRFR